MITHPRLALLALLLACSRPGTPATPPPEAAAPVAEAPSPPTHPTPPGPAAASEPAPTAGASNAPAPSRDGGGAGGVAAAATPQPEPAPAGPLPVPVTAVVAADAAGERPLDGAGPPVIDPSSRFRIEIAVPLLDGRLSLLDAGGAMVPGDASIEIGASWAKFTFSPTEPLVPGSDYALRLDGAVDRLAHDGDGRAYAPSSWLVRTAGEKPRPEPQRKPKPRR